jgi:DNA-directed RNA polymerase beta' subunit
VPVLAVPPPAVNLPVRTDTGQRSEDDYNHVIIKKAIILKIKKLKKVHQRTPGRYCYSSIC